MKKISQAWQLALREPYRLFFPLGVIFSTWGVFYWILFTLGFVLNYPKIAHAQMMLGGFLLPFIVGFLMTALPRFTETKPSTQGEFIAAIILVLALVFAAMSSARERYFYSILLLLILNIGIFATKRVVRRKINPPSSFVFVGLAFLSATIGTILHLISPFWPERPELLIYGKQLLYQDFILTLIIGVGCRLIPGILGWSEVVQRQKKRYENTKPFFSVVGAELGLMIFAYIVAMIATPWQQGFFSHLIRSLIISYIGWRFWRIHKWPSAKHGNARMLWLASWTNILGCWLVIGWPEWRSHFFHLLFVSGFGLTVLLIGSRVSLAHSGLGLATEKKKWLYVSFAGLIIFAALTRISVVFLPESFNNHLAYASGLWIVACLIWAKYFFPKIFSQFMSTPPTTG